MKILTLYLPQFHRIPENDKWWGEGFTEWTNVRRGKSLYAGHYQPRVPDKKDYYDLSKPDVMKQQMKMAKKYGIDGFCFYHYYFCGKKLLEKPAEELLKDKKIDFSFCFAWANQTWSRTWYGDNENREILLKQDYGSEGEWKEHFDYLLPFFQDSRYIKKEGCPLFLIYLPQKFGKCSEMMELWNKMAVENGLKGIYFIAMETLLDEKAASDKFNAHMEFEPLKTVHDYPEWLNSLRNVKKGICEKVCKGEKLGRNRWKNWLFIDNLCSYRLACHLMKKRKRKQNKKIYLGAFPGWDNTARKDECGMVFPGSTPKLFKRQLISQIEASKEMHNDFLFINAWNEWSEGAYLEADERYGYAYLNAVREAKKICGI